MARRKPEESEPAPDSMKSSAMPPMEEFVRRLAGILSDEVAIPAGLNVLPAGEQEGEEANDQS